MSVEEIARRSAVAEVIRRLEEDAAAERRANVEYWDRMCQDYMLVGAPDAEEGLDDWVDVLDEGFDWSIFDEGEIVETPACRFLNEIRAQQGRYMWNGDDKDDRVFLLVELNESTKALFTPENLAKNPEIRCSPAHPEMPLHGRTEPAEGLKLRGLSDAFREVGIGFANIIGLPATTFWSPE